MMQSLSVKVALILIEKRGNENVNLLRQGCVGARRQGDNYLGKPYFSRVIPYLRDEENMDRGRGKVGGCGSGKGVMSGQLREGR